MASRDQRLFRCACALGPKRLTNRQGQLACIRDDGCGKSPTLKETAAIADLDKGKRWSGLTSRQTVSGWTLKTSGPLSSTAPPWHHPHKKLPAADEAPTDDT